MHDLKQLCESYESVLKKRMESLPDYNLKDLRKMVTDKGEITITQTNSKSTKNEISLTKNSGSTTIKTSKSNQRSEDTGFFKKWL